MKDLPWDGIVLGFIAFPVLRMCLVLAVDVVREIHRYYEWRKKEMREAEKEQIPTLSEKEIRDGK